MKKRVLLFVFFITTAVYICAADYQHQVSPNMATIGDVLTYSIDVSYAKNTQLVSIPDSDSFDAFEVRDQRINKEFYDDQWHVNMEYDLAVFDVGEQLIPTQQLLFQREGQGLPLKLKALPVRIDSVLMSTSNVEPVGLRGPMSMPLFWMRYVGMFLGVILGGLLIALGVHYVKSRRQNPVPSVASIDKRSAKDIALEKLEGVLALNLISKGQETEHYVMLTDILKEWLSRLFNASLMDMTSKELLLFSQKKGDDQFIVLLSGFLKDCDLIKFAKQHRSLEQHQQLELQMRKLLDCLL